jgi:hypothetical protein
MPDGRGWTVRVVDGRDVSDRFAEIEGVVGHSIRRATFWEAFSWCVGHHDDSKHAPEFVSFIKRPLGYRPL